LQWCNYDIRCEPWRLRYNTGNHKTLCSVTDIADGSTVWYGQFYNIQHYKDLEQTLRESRSEFSFQAGFQKLIAYLSTEFINLGFGSIDQCINELLKSISEFFEVDRA
jgi:hypothetical protein